MLPNLLTSGAFMHASNRRNQNSWNNRHNTNMVFCNCDLLEDAYDDCAMCHRYNICKDYFTQHPEEINCADDLKPDALKEISSDC